MKSAKKVLVFLLVVVALGSIAVTYKKTIVDQNFLVEELTTQE